MSSPESLPTLEINHKPQQSHDSGAYIDWNSEDSGSSPIMMTADSNVTGEFVTVVAVESGGDQGCGEPSDDLGGGRLSPETPFVTVLSIGDQGEEPPQKICVNVPAVDDVPSRPTSIQLSEIGDDLMDRVEEVFVYRLPGERLGFGLKFEGGTKTAENVRRLFIQSCAPDSPASRAKCSWGRLADGDEVLEVDGAPVAGMTRVDCVRCLKESHVVLRLTVRHSSESVSERTSPTSPVVVSAEMKKSSTPPPPPPIPPRKIPRKPPPSPTKTKPTPPSVVGPPKGFADADYVNMESETSAKPLDNTDSVAETKPSSTSTPKLQQRYIPSSPKNPLKLSLSGSPELTRGMGRRTTALDSVPFPPEAEVYLDLLALEEMSRLNGESESDDTGSSISTVLPTTSNSSFSDLRSSASSTCETTPLSTPGAIDIARVLDPFEQLEREFAATGGGDDFLFTKFVSSQEPVVVSSEQVTVIAGNSTTVIDDDTLALQPPLSFQDAPLSYGDEKVVSTLKDVVDKISELDVKTNSLDEQPLPDKDEFCDSVNKETSDFLSHEVEASIIYRLMDDEPLSNGLPSDNEIFDSKIEVVADEGEVPLITPKPSPRKEAPSSKFKSGKKRPPPPPPPRADRPQAPQPMPRDPRCDELAAKIEKMFDIQLDESAPSPVESTDKVDTASDEGVAQELAVTEVVEVPEEAPLEELDTENLVVKVEEILTPPDDSDLEKDAIHDDVVEVISLDKDDLPVSLVDSEGDDAVLSEAKILEDDDEEDLLPPGFEDCAMMSPSEAFFPFRWTMTSHLATIGEDEEEDDGDATCNDGQPSVLTSEAAKTQSSEEEEVEENASTVEEEKETVEKLVVVEEVEEKEAVEKLVVVEEAEEKEEKEAVEKLIVEEEAEEKATPVIEVEEEAGEVDDYSAALRVSAEPERAPAGHMAPTQTTPVAADEGSMPASAARSELEAPPSPPPQDAVDAPACSAEDQPVGEPARLEGEAEVEMATADVCTPSDTDLSRKIEPRPYADSSSDTSESEGAPLVSSSVDVVDVGHASPAQLVVDSSSPSSDITGIRGTMDAILALDTLTAPTKPLSPTLSPPPSFSRLPPDGHEFPPNYQEPGHFNVGVPALIEMNLSPEPILKEAMVTSPPPLPTSGPPVRKLSQRLDGDLLPPSSPARKFSDDLSSSRPRVSNWRKDEKSERSVKDKIAMFSSAKDLPARRTSKGSSDDIFACEDSDYVDSARKAPSRTPSYRSSLPAQPVPAFGRKSSAIYNSMTDVSSNVVLDNGEPPRSLDFNSRTQSSLDLTSSSSSAYSSSGSPDSSLSYGMGYSSTLPRKLGTTRQSQSVSSSKYSDPIEKPVTLSRATSFSGGNTLHTRSQSLVDIGSIPYSSKRNSISSVGGTRPNEDMRRASLNALIEQRRRGISKLRGLVIPEKVAEVTTTQPIIDLPEIKSRDSILATKPPVIAHNVDHKPSHRRWSTSTDSVPDRSSSHLISTPPWKTQSPAVNLPKYSPAFKRKSLAVYGAPSSASSVSSSLSSSREELRPLFDGSNSQKPPPPLPPSKPPRQFVGNFTPNYGSNLLSQPDPPKSLESITSPTRSDMSFEYVSSCGSSPDLRISAPVTIKDEPVKKISNGHITNGNVYMNGSKNTRLSPTGKMLSSDNGRSEDDSDNDSAVSSSRSSISHGFSPPASPLPDNRTVTEDGQRHHTLHASILSAGNTGESRPLRRTLSSETTASIASSTTSTLTSGSQASCSSNGGSSSGSESKRVLKAQSVEAINRKNVLSSARYSSGKDYKIGSPLIQRKFEEELEKQKLLDIQGGVPHNETIISHNGEDGDIQGKKSTSTEKLYEINNINSSPGNITKDIVLYKTDLEDAPHENSILYFEVQETEVFDETDDADDTVIEVNDKSNKSAPLPAPRHSNSHTPVKSNSTASIDDMSVPTDRWAELTKKYSKNQEFKNDEIDRVPNATNKFLSKPNENEDLIDMYANKNFKTKEFTLDLTNKTLVMNSKDDKSDDDASSSDKSPTSPVDSFSSGKTIESLASPPAVPPKPVQRRNMQNESSIIGDKRESDLMTILTGKSLDQTPLQLRERRRSKDLDSLRPTSMTIERSVSSEEVLPNGGLRSIKTVEQYQEIVSSPTSKVPSAAMRHGSNRRSVSVNDIRKAFEKAELALANTGRANGTKTSSVITSSNGIANHHARVSSLDSTTSDDSYAAIPGYCGSVSTLQKEQFGSVTSIASSTSLISQQELQSLIDEANQVLEECGSCPSPVYEVLVVVLHREMTGGSIGITLAGGADYECKEITVHKVLNGSPADKDGRIQKGDRILSINGKSMKGVTHREALNILKAPRTEVVLVVSRSRPDYDGAAPVEELSAASVRASLSAASSRPPRIPEQPLDSSASLQTEDVNSDVSRGPPILVTLLKDGAGLGFSLEGGKDSPLGDRALTIKKIFTGGCAEKNGTLLAGDELLNVNGADVTSMSRIEAWSLMKRLPDGNVSLTVRHKVTK